MGTIARTLSNQIGSDGKLNAAGLDLTDNYAFTGTVTGTPSTLIKTGSLVSTSAAGSYSLDSVFSSTYKNYFVTFKYSMAADGQDLRLKFRTGGSTNSQSNYQAYFRIALAGGGLGDTTNANGDHIRLAESSESTDTESAQGFMYIFNPFSTATYTHITASFNDKNSSGGAKRFSFGGGMFDATTSFDGFQLTQNTGNGDSVDIQCWGIKE
tara:strand:- start:901 stop:1533 length:633 start_codon:yes stop_codon:yes gene_type:complete